VTVSATAIDRLKRISQDSDICVVHYEPGTRLRALPPQEGTPGDP